ncbi:MAG: PQQ-dependent sugar dehydrogenase [Nitrososphaeraceae archaeon]
MSISNRKHMILILMGITLIVVGYYFVHSVYPQISIVGGGVGAPMVVNNPNLKVETVFKGLRPPTNMAFLGPNDILVLEKDDGTVQRIVNGTMLPQPLLQVPVATESERGMLGIAVAKHKNGPAYVFLYYTESGGGKAGDDSTSQIDPAGNRLYRYELVNNRLVNPKLLLSLPATPGPNHDGGKVVIGPDNNVYVVIGDLRSHRTQAQNVVDGPPVDGTGGIIRITQDGQAVADNPLGRAYPQNLYYAYGIRNSFGMDFDPLTGNLWDTENGPNYGDEINLVEPGFNSGWAQVQGLWTPNGDIGDENAGPIDIHPSNLVDFGGKGKYRSPGFTWYQVVAPTAIKFLNSNKLGKEYENDMFVGDYLYGNLYHFKLNQNRTGLLLLEGPLASKVENTLQDLDQVIFAKGFGAITDIQVGPDDGYLYVLTLAGSIYRIIPASPSTPSPP